MSKLRYFIISDETTVLLSDRVNKWIADGYKPVGGPFVTASTTLNQAMYYEHTPIFIGGAGPP